MMPDRGRVLLILGDSTRHLGLFSDLYHWARIDVLFYPNNSNTLRKVASRVSPSLLFRYGMAIQSVRPPYDRVVVLDSALARMNKSTISWLREMSLNVDLIILNSFGAASPTFELAKQKVSWFDATEVHTFDPHDAEIFGFQFLGLSYYSHRELPSADEGSYDFYFVGGLKGGREQLLLRVFDRLTSHFDRVRFDCSVVKGSRNLPGLYPYINWSFDGWFPYSTVLQRTASARCLVEVLQKGQGAQSLRYFEAVCYNRLLLTNNEAVTDLPYYDSRYMKVFRDESDLDIDWAKNTELPDYRYSGEFSPVNLSFFRGYNEEA